MAISLVEAQQKFANNGNNVVFTFGGSVTTGDFAIIVGGHPKESSNSGVSSPSGYTETSYAGINSMSVSYKFLSGDTTVTCRGSADTTDGTAYVMYVFRGVDTSSPLDTSIVSATGATGNPNSDSITTTVFGAVVLTAFLMNKEAALISAPGGYGDAKVTASNDDDNVTAGIASRYMFAAQAENPEPWNLTQNTEDWRALTIALRPAIQTATIDGVLTSTGTATATYVASFTSLGAGIMSITATGTAAWVGQAIALTGKLEATGTGSVTFVGIGTNEGVLSSSATCTVTWVGDKEYMSSVREVIESRGAVSVTVQ